MTEFLNGALAASIVWFAASFVFFWYFTYRISIWLEEEVDTVLEKTLGHLYARDVDQAITTLQDYRSTQD